MPHSSLLRARCVLTAGVILLVPDAARTQTFPRVRVTLPAYPYPVAIDTILVVTEHDASAGRVYAALDRVFADLKIPVDTRDSAQGVFGIKRYNKSTSLAGQMMSRVVNCGTGLTGPNADNFRLSITIVAIALPTSATHTRLGVGVLGSGTDMRGNASDPVACATTGWLENEIALRVNKATAMP